MPASAPAPSFDDTVHAVADVDGWMTPAQARLLWDTAQEVAPGGRIVEIGSFRGRSTIVLGRAVGPRVELVAIDPHAGNDRGPQEIAGFEDEAADDHEVFNANLERAGVQARVRHVRAFSHLAHPEVEGDVDLLYIDGAHRYGPALADIRQWGDRVAPGGTMLIHDSFSSVGVTLAIARALFLGGRYRYLGRTGSMTRYRREPLGLRERLTNAGRQLVELPWFVRNLVMKGLIVIGARGLTRRLGHDPDMWPH